MKRHIALHFSQRNFVCETCGAAFHTKRTLQTHIVYKHSQNKVHKCAECDHCFKTANSLQRHLLIHSKEKKHRCKTCSKEFNRLNNLRRHMNRVHGMESDLPPTRKVKLIDVPQGLEFAKGISASLGKPEAPRQQSNRKATVNDKTPPKLKAEGLPAPPVEKALSEVASQNCITTVPTAMTTTPSSTILLPLSMVKVYASPQHLQYMPISQTVGHNNNISTCDSMNSTQIPSTSIVTSSVLNLNTLPNIPVIVPRRPSQSALPSSSAFPQSTSKLPLQEEMTLPTAATTAMVFCTLPRPVTAFKTTEGCSVPQFPTPPAPALQDLMKTLGSFGNLSTPVSSSQPHTVGLDTPVLNFRTP